MDEWLSEQFRRRDAGSLVRSFQDRMERSVLTLESEPHHRRELEAGGATAGQQPEPAVRLGSAEQWLVLSSDRLTEYIPP